MCCVSTGGGWWSPSAGSSSVIGINREVDAAAAEGFAIVNSFTVDDNVYLVLQHPD